MDDPHLPASTQWEIVEEEAEVIKAARNELIRQAAQGGPRAFKEEVIVEGGHFQPVFEER